MVYKIKFMANFQTVLLYSILGHLNLKNVFEVWL